jgi:hypothetical protein
VELTDGSRWYIDPISPPPRISDHAALQARRRLIRRIALQARRGRELCTALRRLRAPCARRNPDHGRRSDMEVRRLPPVATASRCVRPNHFLHRDEAPAANARAMTIAITTAIRRVVQLVLHSPPRYDSKFVLFICVDLRSFAAKSSPTGARTCPRPSPTTSPCASASPPGRCRTPRPPADPGPGGRGGPAAHRGEARGLKVKDLKAAADGELADIDPDALKAALALLKGEGDRRSATRPPLDPYAEGDMPGSVRVACASNGARPSTATSAAPAASWSIRSPRTRCV